MVIDKLSDFEGFLEVVEQCKGDVEVFAHQPEDMERIAKFLFK